MAGTASAAADLLGVSQPAISRAIADLERSVGFPLFVRIRGRLVPSPEGQLLYKEVDRAFVGMEQLRAASVRIRSVGTGELKIASLAAVGSSIVPAAIAAFRREHPNVRISFRILNSTAVRDLVASGQVDLGIAADEVDTSGVPHRVFATPAAVCALPLGHRLCEKSAIGPDDLAGEALIAFVPEDTARGRMDRVFAEAGVTPNVVIETIYSSSVCDLVLAGAGVGIASAYSRQDYRNAPIVFRPFEPAVNTRSLLLFPPNRQQSGLERDFLKLLYEARNHDLKNSA